MKQNRAGLSQKYVAALGKNLKQGSPTSLKPALELGRQAAVLGLETLDLARIHEQALATLKLSNVKNAFTKLAGIFFTEVNTAIEEKHRAAREIMVTEEVSAINGKSHNKCLEESLELQKCLRQLTHRVRKVAATMKDWLMKASPKRSLIKVAKLPKPPLKRI